MRRIVEVSVPALGACFDFSLPAKMTVYNITLLMLQTLAANTEFMFSQEAAGHGQRFKLFYLNEDGECIELGDTLTLQSAGVQDGGRLILV